jgi:ketosteroid isomerase-like protein
LALDNEHIVRTAYQIAEDKDLAGWAAAFTADGTFTDLSIGVTWTGRDRQLTDPRAGKLIALPDRLGVTRQ